ncbi:MAG TPA: sugar ABC transporter permease [Streptosporangiaceae bacterium]|jgi:multiple sugar transport system permease protein|nr:sugar ABC transporter permease [Streptosporangiaceae bacterium]
MTTEPVTTEAPARQRRPRPQRPQPGSRGRPVADRRLGYVLVAPTVILLLAVTAFPMISNVWNSLHFDNLSFGGLPHKFVGGQNYSKMFTSPEWISALERTLAFTVVTIVFDVVVGLALALMLHRRFRGRGFVRAAILVPWAVPTVVSAMLWKTMFDPRAGFVDYFLGAIHPSWSSLTWVNANVWRSWAVIFVSDSWKNIPFVAIILLAGLQVIPPDVYEAARIDGASAWQAFRKLTLPLLKPALSVALIFRTLQALLVFDVVFILTGGGPGTSTESLFFLNYQTFITNTDFGYGGAQSVFLVVLALIVSAVYVRWTRPVT